VIFFFSSKVFFVGIVSEGIVSGGFFSKAARSYEG